MIKYRGGAFGFRILLRMHGSAVFKALTPSLISTAVFLVFYNSVNIHDDEYRLFDHPYPIGALMVAFTFLLSFKASFSYGRYWEACTAVYQMHSKWMDVGMEMAAFHLQSDTFEKPPAYGHYPELTGALRERERLNEMTREDFEQHLDEVKTKTLRQQFHRAMSFKIYKDKKPPPQRKLTKKNINAPCTPKKKPTTKHPIEQQPSSIHTTTSMQSNTSQQSVIVSSIKKKTTIEPSLFMQESAHLLSLMSAVAFSTLRCDLEDAETPLATFVPDAPWPHEDPDDYHADVRKGWEQTSRTLVAMRYLLGMTRDSKSRTLYNAARPFRVIGGVSDAEVRMIQSAKGPLAKVALCSLWLQEFISREYLAGSTGNVAPPIVSRLYQFISDGMLGYNQARKIAYIPFPFPHAQITSLFVLVVVVFIPILMLSYVNNIVLGGILNFFTVLCFTGLHEVSRELENPFRNAPNDIPLNNYQAQFNEGLRAGCFGYHPDAWWVAREDIQENILASDELLDYSTSSHKSEETQLSSILSAGDSPSRQTSSDDTVTTGNVADQDVARSPRVMKPLIEE